MIKSLLLIAAPCVALFSCTNHQQREIVDTNFYKKEVVVSFKDLTGLLDGIKNVYFVDKKVATLNFSKKFNGVYISNKMINAKEPLHWIHVDDVGRFSNVSFSTADFSSWESIIKELKQLAAPEI